MGSRVSLQRTDLTDPKTLGIPATNDRWDSQGQHLQLFQLWNQ
jgi:hypothetical protein